MMDLPLLKYTHMHMGINSIPVDLYFASCRFYCNNPGPSWISKAMGKYKFIQISLLLFDLERVPDTSCRLFEAASLASHLSYCDKK